METVKVELGKRSYEIVIDDGLITRAGPHCRAAFGSKTRKIAVISNARVHKLYGMDVERSLKREGFTVGRILIGDGERAKSLRTAEKCWGELLANHYERGDGIVALGGGVVGDLAGFVAACFQRGMEFIQIPTTLLAQIDSSVGGKTAVNHALGKNMIGAFHQPRCVIIDPQVLRTLPRRELNAGTYEALKHGVIRDRALFDFIVAHRHLLQAFDSDTIAHIVKRSVEIKSEVVRIDERESGLRRILNFGHTVGHALESLTGYRRLKHGEAVGYGMQAAALIAERAGILSGSDQVEIDTAVREISRLPRVNDLNSRSIEQAMKHDKKASQGRIPLILPTRIGEVIVKDDVSREHILAGIRGILGK